MAGYFLDERLKDNRPVYITWQILPGAVVAETLARSDFDACCLDMQHGLMDFADVLAMMTAIHKAGKPALVRPPLGGEGLQAKVLDAGAAGIIVPMINTPHEARALVETSKYPPLGKRSWGAYLAQAASGLSTPEYLGSANRLFKTFAMIETAEAMDNVDAIASTDGIDGLFVGPNDLCISLTGGEAPDYHHPKVKAALPVIVKAAKAAGKVPGIFASTPEIALEFAALGFRLISVGTDAGFLSAGAQTAHSGLKS